MKELDVITRNVILTGLRELMFDRYPGDTKQELQPEQKMYLNERREMILPVANIYSFLFAQNTTSAAKFFYDPRKYRAVAQALAAHVYIEPAEIPITREDAKPIVFTEFKIGEIELHKSVARLPKGIPNAKARPLLRLPWQLSFVLSFYQNEWINETGLRNLFERGGILIGLGTFRGIFGKFAVSQWE